MTYLRRHLRDIPEEHRASALEFLSRVLDDCVNAPTVLVQGACIDTDTISRDARMIQQEVQYR